ncbi:hypothetical protein HNQ76_001744 [Thermosulfuriphilus ammonigenes]|nr:hypothetical protein [Thermosulfuriphilus ammonigenes]
MERLHKVFWFWALSNKVLPDKRGPGIGLFTPSMMTESPWLNLKG